MVEPLLLDQEWSSGVTHSTMLLVQLWLLAVGRRAWNSVLLQLLRVTGPCLQIVMFSVCSPCTMKDTVHKALVKPSWNVNIRHRKFQWIEILWYTKFMWMLPSLPLQSLRGLWQSPRSGWCVGRRWRPWPTFMRSRSSTETWRPGTSFSHRRETSNWVRPCLAGLLLALCLRISPTVFHE